MSQDKIYQLLNDNPETWFSRKNIQKRLSLSSSSTTKGLNQMVIFRVVECRPLLIWTETNYYQSFEYKIKR